MTATKNAAEMTAAVMPAPTGDRLDPLPRGPAKVQHADQA